MSLHKLTAGDGYTYLTRQVAAQDATDRGAAGLADYYAEKGESPGRWWGSGLEGIGVPIGAQVTEAQMKSLFGEGRHPDAAARRHELVREGGTVAAADAASRLGQPFRIASSETEFAQRVAAAYAEHNRVRGATWSTGIDPQTRAVIRTRIADEMFVERYGRSPADERERHGFVAQESRQRTTSVAGFDLTFTPVKSVSALWALANQATAAEIEAAHAAAVQDTLAWLESNVLFTRRGHNGVRQVATRGLIATVFTHRDSRAGDPNLHTHVAVSNKVQDSKGRWLAVDARVLFKANVSLSEHYNTRLEAELGSRLHLRFSRAETGLDRGRPVREVVGVDPRLMSAWSRRRRAIDDRRRDLARRFQHDHGRPPTASEVIALSQQANLETREVKHSPRSEREQRAAWAREAAKVLGSGREVRAMVKRTLSPAPSVGPFTAVTPEWVALTAAQVIATIEASRATWQTWHLRAEAERQARYADVPLAQLDSTVDAVVRRAIEVESIPLGDPDPAHRADLTPSALRRSDGTPAYDVHGTTQFTSQRILDAESAILDAAGRCDGRIVPQKRLRALTTGHHAAERVVRLSDEQNDLVVRLAGTAPRVQVALAPAGAGKTTCMKALAALWIEDGGRVLGLAPSAAAAHQLRESLSPDNNSSHEDPIACDTLAKLTWALDHPDDQPGWVNTVDDTTMLIVDEAAMAGTIELSAVIQHVVSRGGTVRLVGDDRQLASVAAGGIVRDIAERYGAASLTEPRRFTDPVEAAATLALRDGDPLALGYYADHDRLHVGDATFCADQAYDAWQADQAAGRSSVLMAPTRELVRALNARAQRDRAASAASVPDAAAVHLADGTTAHIGDLVITQRNDRRLGTTDTDWVKNGDRWTLSRIGTDGSLRLQHITQRHHVIVPAAYAAEHVVLGYATTIHAAQGMTVDTAHAVLTGDEDRSLVYVALTRGRHANHVYVAVTPRSGDGSAHPHDLVTRPETLAPPTAVEILSTALARESQADSATSAGAAGTLDGSFADQSGLLREAADRYRDALHVAAEELLGSDAVDRLPATAESVAAGLTAEPAWEALRADLLLTAIDTQQDPSELLMKVIERHGLEGAHDMAAVINSRLPEHRSSVGRRTDAPLPWLPDVPTIIDDDPAWQRYLDERRTWVTTLAAGLCQAADGWRLQPDSQDVPRWARPLVRSNDPELVGDLALWRAVEGVDPADLTITGRARMPGIAGDHQRGLEQRATLAMANAETGVDPELLPDVARADPVLPHLQSRLQELAASGVDVEQTLTATFSDTRDLPSEVPAAALWWRAQAHHVPAAGNDDRSGPDLLASIEPDPRWSVTSSTHYNRIVELHRRALAYYTELYPRSWAPDYLASRFYDGWEHDVPGLAVGYAPPGPCSLSRHLLGGDVAEQELVDAGLAKRREHNDGTYRLVDTFRDRAVFALRDPLHPEDIVGFVGRRNPRKEDDPYGGPKYLNTRTTAAYAKSDNLFGLDLLVRHPSARAVLVEGPLDALAVTLATAGATIGVASLGTAFTERQAILLALSGRSTRPHPVLMFDGDDAGAEAAARAADALATVRLSPRLACLPDGADPGQLVREGQGQLIERLIASADPMSSAPYVVTTAMAPPMTDSERDRLREAAQTPAPRVQNNVGQRLI